MLDWFHRRPSKRRRMNFPTWSWSGWEGAIEFRKTYFGRYSSTDSTYAPIFLEIPDNLTDPCDQKIRCLHVTGAITKLKFATQKQARSIIDGAWQHLSVGEILNLVFEAPLHHCVFEVSPGIFAVIRSNMDIEPEVGDQTFGLFVTIEARESFYIRSIIVLRKGDQSFTRIGCITVADV